VKAEKPIEQSRRQTNFFKMKKLKLNKKTVSVLDKKEMKTVNGGNATIVIDPGDQEFLSIASCRASRSGRDCCSSGPCV